MAGCLLAPKVACLDYSMTKNGLLVGTMGIREPVAAVGVYYLGSLM